MDNKEVEQWLRQQAKNKNALASAYLSLLENASPEMKAHWFQALGNSLGAIKQNEESLREQILSGK